MKRLVFVPGWPVKTQPQERQLGEDLLQQHRRGLALGLVLLALSVLLALRLDGVARAAALASGGALTGYALLAFREASRRAQGAKRVSTTLLALDCLSGHWMNRHANVTAQASQMLALSGLALMIPSVFSAALQPVGTGLIAGAAVGVAGAVLSMSASPWQALLQLGGLPPHRRLRRARRGRVKLSPTGRHALHLTSTESAVIQGGRATSSTKTVDPTH